MTPPGLVFPQVVLNIYNQRDPLVRAYLNGPAARSASLPETLVGALRSQCLILADRAMAAGVGGERRLSWEGRHLSLVVNLCNARWICAVFSTDWRHEQALCF